MTGQLQTAAGVMAILVLTTGVTTATAQVARSSRFVISGDVGVQTTVNTRTDKVKFDLFAETGRFAEAVTTNQSAMEIAGEKGQGRIVEQLRGRHDLYLACRPFRDARK